MGLKKEFFKDVIVYGLGNGIKKFIGLFLLPFYTRALSVKEYGILDSLSTFGFLISTFLNLGLDSATGFYFYKSDENQKGKILFSHLLMKLIAFLPCIIVLFFSNSIAYLLFKDKSFNLSVIIAILAIPFNLLVNEQSNIYRYYRKPWGYNLITIIKSFSNIIFGISLVVILKKGVLGAQYANLISSFIVILFSFASFTRKKYTYQYDVTSSKKMVKFGFPLIWAGLLIWGFSSSNRIFLLHYANLTQIGYYSVGLTFSQPVLLLNMAVQMSFGVLFYKTYYADNTIDKLDAKKLAIDSMNMYLIAALWISSFCSIFGIELLKIVTTKEYVLGCIAIPFLSFSNIASQAYQIMAPGITIVEKNWIYTVITAIACIFSLFLNFILIPRLGYVGACISTFLSYLIYWILKVHISLKYFYINYPFAKIYFLFSITFIISLIIPVTFIYLSLSIPFYIKMVFFLLCLILPFGIRLITFAEVKNLLTFFKAFVPNSHSNDA